MNYKITYSDDYLAHHGILGQKWGIRRYRNEDGTLTDAGKKRYNYRQMKADRASALDRFKKSHPYNKKMAELENKAFELTKKYDFAHDDGGGGKTDADRRAGQKYMEYFNERDYWEQERDREASSQATKYLIDKYGSDAVESLEKHQKRVMMAGFVAMESVMAAILVGITRL